MARDTISERVEKLELTVQGLTELPAAVAEVRQDITALTARVGGVELQILQLRTEMTAEFSAVRAEMKAASAAVRVEMQEMGAGLHSKIDENWRRTLVLHEDLVNRIKTLGEQWNGASTRRPPKRK